MHASAPNHRRFRHCCDCAAICECSHRDSARAQRRGRAARSRIADLADGWLPGQSHRAGDQRHRQARCELDSAHADMEDGHGNIQHDRCPLDPDRRRFATSDRPRSQQRPQGFVEAACGSSGRHKSLADQPLQPGGVVRLLPTDDDPLRHYRSADWRRGVLGGLRTGHACRVPRIAARG